MSTRLAFNACETCNRYIQMPQIWPLEYNESAKCTGIEQNPGRIAQVFIWYLEHRFQASAPWLRQKMLQTWYQIQKRILVSEVVVGQEATAYR